ncbi:MAG: DUF2501 domain-containing protein [Rhodanobacter sp.]
MKTRIGSVAIACAAAMTLGLACTAASAQDLGSLGSKLGGSGGLGGMLPGGGQSGSMGNVAGILQYCVKNNYLGGDSGASGIAGKLLGKTEGGSSNADYSSGASGILKGKDGSSTNLGSIGGGNSDMKSKLTTKACGVVLNQGKSFLGGGSSSTGKLGSLLGH